MVSQLVLHGTVTPTHYTIVEDELELGPTRTQQLAYRLAFMNFLQTGPIRWATRFAFSNHMARFIFSSWSGTFSPTWFWTKIVVLHIFFHMVWGIFFLNQGAGALLVRGPVGPDGRGKSETKCPPRSRFEIVLFVKNFRLKPWTFLKQKINRIYQCKQNLKRQNLITYVCYTFLTI